MHAKPTSDAWNPLPSPAAFGVNAPTGSPQGNGFVGGFNFGYNYQFWSSWVAGIEGDIMWGAVGTNNAGPWVTPGGAVVAGSLTNFSTQLNWLSSVRGRLGWLWTPNLMIYGTGGAAWANVHYCANAFNGVTGGPGSYNANVDFTTTSDGWVAGVGVEWLISNNNANVWWNNWTLRTEWLHYQLQDAQNVNGTSVNFPAFPLELYLECRENRRAPGCSELQVLISRSPGLISSPERSLGAVAFIDRADPSKSKNFE